MNASIAIRSTVILGTVAVIWGGCAYWASQRERAAKDALVAEIRAEMAARPPARDWAAGRVDLTPEYDAILAPLVSGSPSDETALLEALEGKQAWSGLPKVVKSALDAHAPSLALLDALVADRPAGTMSMGRDWNRWRRLRILLEARGRARLATRDWVGVLATVRALRRVSEDFLASTVPEMPVVPAVYSLVWSKEGSGLLDMAVLHPELPEAVAVEALVLASEPWSVDAAHERIDEGWLREGDRLCLDLLGDDADEVLRKYGFVQETSFLDRAGRIFKDEDRLPGAIDGPPSVETLRALRAISERYRRASETKDATAVAVGGELERAAEANLGGGWRARRLNIHPVGARRRWRDEARVPVLRAAFALRIHEARTGRLPETLGELVPAILDAVPLDPWTGKPVAYTRKPGGGWIVEAGPSVDPTPPEEPAEEGNRPFRLER